MKRILTLTFIMLFLLSGVSEARTKVVKIGYHEVFVAYTYKVTLFYKEINGEKVDLNTPDLEICPIQISENFSGFALISEKINDLYIKNNNTNKIEKVTNIKTLINLDYTNDFTPIACGSGQIKFQMKIDDVLYTLEYKY